MGSPGNCTQQDNDNNAKSANGAYYPTSALVVATSSQNNTVTIAVPLKSGGTGQYTLGWGNQSVMWPACPSSLPSQATPSNAGPLPSVNASGKLYLSQGFLNSNPNVAYDAPKWPAAFAGAVPYAPLEIWVSNLVLTGLEMQTGAYVEASIDLLDPQFAQAGQAITTERGTVTLLLGPRAFHRFNVEMPDITALKEAVNVIAASTKSASPHDAHEVAYAWRSVADWMARVQAAPDSSDPKHAEARSLLKKVTAVG